MIGIKRALGCNLNFDTYFDRTPVGGELAAWLTGRPITDNQASTVPLLDHGLLIDQHLIPQDYRFICAAGINSHTVANKDMFSQREIPVVYDGSW